MPAEIAYTCAACGERVRALVAVLPDGSHETRILSHPSSFVCEHWSDVHAAIADLADGLDPAARCAACDCNPCVGGNGPGSCVPGADNYDPGALLDSLYRLGVLAGEAHARLVATFAAEHRPDEGLTHGEYSAASKLAALLQALAAAPVDADPGLEAIRDHLLDELAPALAGYRAPAPPSEDPVPDPPQAA